MEIATKTGTVTYSIEEAQSIIDENGKPFDQSKAGELAGLVWGMIADAFKFSNSTSPIPADRSLKGFFVEKLEEKDLSPEEKRVVMQAAEVFGGFVGELIHKQSLKYFWLEECLEGGSTTIYTYGFEVESY